MTRTDSPPIGMLRDEVDEELLALPDPPRGERTLTLVALLLAAVMSLAFAFSLRHDVAYALSRSEPSPVGALAHVDLAQLPHNAVVTAEATLGLAGAMRFERPFVEDGLRLVPVLGRNDLWVELTIPHGEVVGRFVAPTALRGRLVPFDQAGPHHRGLAAQLEELHGAPLPEGALLLVQNEEPRSLRSAVLMALAAIVAAAVCVLSAARILRKVRS